MKTTFENMDMDKSIKTLVICFDTVNSLEKGVTRPVEA